MESHRIQEGLRIVAVFEAAKGALILIAGFGLLAYIQPDLHHAASRLVRHFRLNPASHYPRIFVDLANNVTNGHLWIMALFALIYASIRFAEAYGLWYERHWAEWMAVLTGGIYLPLELFEIARGITWPKVTLLVVNAGIVAYMSLVLYQARHKGDRRQP